MEYIRKTFTYDHQRYTVYGKTEEECIKKKAKKLQELANNSQLRSRDAYLKDWAMYCFETYKVNMADITKEKFLCRMKVNVLDELGNYKLRQIRSIDVQKCLNNKKGKSQYIIKQTRDILNWLFERAIDNDMLLKNPVRGTVLPKGTKTERRALTDEEYEKITKLLENEKYAVLGLSLYMGCRPGEARNMKWSDFYQDKNGNWLCHIRGTKSKNADRVVPVPYNFVKMIQSSPNYVGLSLEGNKMDDKCYQRRWHSLIRELDMDSASDLVPYCFRHHYCTTLANKGVPLAIAMKLMGHSDIRLTAGIYQHQNESMIQEAQRYINTL